MVKNTNKKGFSIAETLIVLIIMSVVFGATAKILTKKRPNDAIVHQHGQYECWLNGSNYISRYIIEGQEAIQTENTTGCSFKPNLDISLYHVYLVYRNQRGFNLMTIHNIAQEMNITFTSQNIVIENKITEEKSLYGPDPIEEGKGDYNAFKTSIEQMYSNLNLISQGDAGKISHGVLIVW